MEAESRKLHKEEEARGRESGREREPSQERTVIWGRLVLAHEEDGKYILSLGDPYGFEESDNYSGRRLEEWLRKLNDGERLPPHKHRRLECVVRGKTEVRGVLGLAEVGSEGDDPSSVFVEIGCYGFPVVISEKGLRWVREYDRLIEEYEAINDRVKRATEKDYHKRKEEAAKSSGSFARRLGKIIDGLAKENPQLLGVFYERLAQDMQILGRRFNGGAYSSIDVNEKITGMRLGW